MSQGVTKLKQLLFDNETATLADFARRLDLLAADGAATREDLLRALAEASDSTRKDLTREIASGLDGARQSSEATRAELTRRLDQVFARAGDDEALTRAVAAVIDRALVDAEKQRHEPLAQAVAPLVVRTVRAEIRNSRDEIVEAIYPMTGQMVRAYVASAMKDLVAEVNRRLEQNPLMLRLRSLTTGRSMAELAIADSQRLQVEELLLVARGSGELIARWPQPHAGQASGNHDHVLGGVLTAINSFVSEALESDENALRQIDLGQSTVYLRASPGLLLAAKCSGSAARSVERIIDDEFLATVAQLAPAAGNAATVSEELAALGPRLEERIEEKHAELASPGGVSPLKLVAVAIGLPLLAWIGWSTYVRYETDRVREVATAIIETSGDIKGYPTRLMVSPRGKLVTITGLAPSADAQTAIGRRLAVALPGSEIDNQLAILPRSAPDQTPEIAGLRRQLADLTAELPRQIATRALDRASESLAAAAGELDQLAALSAGSSAGGAAASASAAARASVPGVAEARKALAGLRSAFDPSGSAIDGGAIATRIDAVTAAIADTADRLGRAAHLTDGATASRAPAVAQKSPASTATDRTPAGFAADAERLAAQAARLSSVATALRQAELVRAAIPPPPAPDVAAAPAPPSAFDRLVQYVRTNAIFFADDTTLRDATVATAQIDRLAALLRESGAFVRIVGYTDGRGSTSRNSTLSQSRALFVLNMLRDRGVPPAQMIAVGRESLLDISPDTGPGSANRRVEFEIGFIGEGAAR